MLKIVQGRCYEKVLRLADVRWFLLTRLHCTCPKVGLHVWVRAFMAELSSCTGCSGVGKALLLARGKVAVFAVPSCSVIDFVVYLCAVPVYTMQHKMKTSEKCHNTTSRLPGSCLHLHSCALPQKILLKRWRAGRQAREKTQNLSTRYSTCLLYTSPSPRDGLLSRMPSSA